MTKETGQSNLPLVRALRPPARRSSRLADSASVAEATSAKEVAFDEAQVGAGGLVKARLVIFNMLGLTRLG